MVPPCGLPRRRATRWRRLSAQNLLDKEKRETFLKYDGDSVEEILDNRANGDLDEYELESERSGVLYQVTVRAAF